MTRGVKKIMQSKIPNLGKYGDISEYMNRYVSIRLYWQPDKLSCVFYFLTVINGAIEVARTKTSEKKLSMFSINMIK